MSIHSNSPLQVGFRWLGDGPPRLPRYQSALAAGLDVEAHLSEPLTIQPLQRLLIPTGFAISLPEGYEAQLRPRSGLALKHGLTLLNSPGTIDADYRGEIKVLLINLGAEPYTITPHQRIAQLIIAPVTKISWTLLQELPPTDRNEGGFGSTEQ